MSHGQNMQVAGGRDEAMKQAGQGIDRSGSVDIYDLRLMTLLHELVRKNRKWGAARVLGVDPRTVALCMRTGRLSRRVREALELGLQSGQGTAAALQRERNDALEQRIGEVEQRLRTGLDEMQASVAEQIAGLGEELQQGAGLSESLRDVERRLARLEPAAGGGGSATEDDAGPGAGRTLRPATQGEAPFRPYPELVTLALEPGEELVYGDAMGTVAAWREAQAAFARSVEAGSVLDRAVARERVLELELELIEEHELTLPPADYPWAWADRAAQALRRRRSLWEVRSERGRAELRRRLRRVLSLGLWRG